MNTLVPTSSHAPCRGRSEHTLPWLLNQSSGRLCRGLPSERFSSYSLSKSLLSPYRAAGTVLGPREAAVTPHFMEFS